MRSEPDDRTLTLRTLEATVFLGIYVGLEGDTYGTDTSDREPLAAVELSPAEALELGRELLRRGEFLRVGARRQRRGRHAV